MAAGHQSHFGEIAKDVPDHEYCITEGFVADPNEFAKKNESLSLRRHLAQYHKYRELVHESCLMGSLMPAS